MNAHSQAVQSRVASRLSHRLQHASERPTLVVTGELRRTVGLTLEAEGLNAAVGSHCSVIGDDGRRIDAEVVGFSGERTFLMPSDRLHGLSPNARVVPSGAPKRIAAGPALLGRVIDARGRPLDGAGDIRGQDWIDLRPEPINPLARLPISEPLDVGVRSINALLPIGRGQRLGLFAGSGVGKSVLLGMMTRFTDADVIVVGLIGERGREVKEFVNDTLGDGLQRAVVVASPADDPPLSRLQGASVATSIAEYFRAQGLKVLLLMDSLTRYAQAQREIALAIGEPPATKGYPPSVFARLPQLVERAGNGANGSGSITAIYTVLAEGDDQSDPVVDAARAILDGHIVLSRSLADSGHYPAIDIEQSVSRATLQIATPEHRARIQTVREWYSVYQQNKDLLSVGAYQHGVNPQTDLAVAQWTSIGEFLRQGADEPVSRSRSLDALGHLTDMAPPELKADTA